MDKLNDLDAFVGRQRRDFTDDYLHTLGCTLPHFRPVTSVVCLTDKKLPLGTESRLRRGVYPPQMPAAACRLGSHQIRFLFLERLEIFCTSNPSKKPLIP